MTPDASLGEQNGLVPFPTGASAKGWHSIEALSWCPKAYQYGHIRGIVPIGRNTRALDIGTLCHIGRAQFFAGPPGTPTCWAERMREYARINNIEPAYLQVALETMQRYVDSILGVPREIVACEYTAGPYEFFPGLARTARYDAIERVDGTMFINELKTTSNTPDSVYNLYGLSGQLMLQYLLWGEKEKEQWGELGGIILEVMPLVKYSPVSYRITFSEHQLAWFRRTINDMQADAASITWSSPARRCVSLKTCPTCDFRNLCKLGAGGLSYYSAPPPPQGAEVNTWE